MKSPCGQEPFHTFERVPERSPEVIACAGGWWFVPPLTITPDIEYVSVNGPNDVTYVRYPALCDWENEGGADGNGIDS